MSEKHSNITLPEEWKNSDEIRAKVRNLFTGMCLEDLTAYAIELLEEDDLDRVIDIYCDALPPEIDFFRIPEFKEAVDRAFIRALDQGDLNHVGQIIIYIFKRSDDFLLIPGYINSIKDIFRKFVTSVKFWHTDLIIDQFRFANSPKAPNIDFFGIFQSICLEHLSRGEDAQWQNIKIHAISDPKYSKIQENLIPGFEEAVLQGYAYLQVHKNSDGNDSNDRFQFKKTHSRKSDGSEMDYSKSYPFTYLGYLNIGNFNIAEAFSSLYVKYSDESIVDYAHIEGVGEAYKKCFQVLLATSKFEDAVFLKNSFKIDENDNPINYFANWDAHSAIKSRLLTLLSSNSSLEDQKVFLDLINGENIDEEVLTTIPIVNREFHHFLFDYLYKGKHSDQSLIGHLGDCFSDNAPESSFVNFRYLLMHVEANIRLIACNKFGIPRSGSKHDEWLKAPENQLKMHYKIKDLQRECSLALNTICSQEFIDRFSELYRNDSSLDCLIENAS